MAINLVGLKCACCTRALAHVGQAYVRVPLHNFCCVHIQSAGRVAREDSLLAFPVPSSHGSKD